MFGRRKKSVTTTSPPVRGGSVHQYVENKWPVTSRGVPEYTPHCSCGWKGNTEDIRRFAEQHWEYHCKEIEKQIRMETDQKKEQEEYRLQFEQIKERYQ